MPPVPEYPDTLPPPSSRPSGGASRARGRSHGQSQSNSAYFDTGNGHIINTVLHDETAVSSSGKRNIDAVFCASGGGGTSRKRPASAGAGVEDSGLNYRGTDSLLDEALKRVWQEKHHSSSSSSSSAPSKGSVVGASAVASNGAVSSSRGFVKILPILPALDYCLVCRLESKETEGLLLRCDFPSCGRSYHPVNDAT